MMVTMNTAPHATTRPAATAAGPSAAAADAFGDARHFSMLAELADALERDVPAGVNLLVKGSRSMRLEIVIERLVSGEGR